MKLDFEKLDTRLAEEAKKLLPALEIEEGEHGMPVVTERNDEGLEMYFSNDGSLVISYKEEEDFFRAFAYVKRMVDTGVPIKEKR